MDITSPATAVFLIAARRVPAAAAGSRPMPQEMSCGVLRAGQVLVIHLKWHHIPAIAGIMIMAAAVVILMWRRLLLVETGSVTVRKRMPPALLIALLQDVRGPILPIVC